MDRTWNRWSLGLVLIGTMLGAPALAQPTGATLSGVVRDAANNPIDGATVTVTDDATQAVETTHSSADGSYSIDLSPGTYRVRATARGFWGPLRSVDLVAGRASQLDLSLSPVMTEVVSVTATKHDEAPIDVPFSVAAYSEEELRQRGATSIEDLAANDGSLTVQNLGPGQSQVAMRGVSSGQIARDQPGVKEQVGIYLDESPVSMSLFTPDLDLVDVTRVEVLRGPQGTLFGAGSETGTVRYISNAPVLNTTEGFVEFGAAAVADGSGSGELKAVVNVPLGERAAARVVGYATRFPGVTDAIQPDLSVDDDVDDGSRKGVRFALAFAPNDRLTITPRIVAQHVERDGWNLQDEYNILANPFTTTRPPVTMRERTEFTQLDEKFDDEFVLGDLDVRYDFGNAMLTSITSWSDRKIRIIRDTTALTASFTGGNMGAPEPVYTLDSPMYDYTDATTWTQELRLSAERERVKWVAGLFYSRAERDYGQDVQVPGFTAATGIPTQGLLAPEDSIYFSEFEYELEQRALFGEATVDLTDRFSLTGGARFYDYEEDKEQRVDGAFGNPDNGNSILELPGSTDANGAVPRVIGTWKISPDAFLNAQYSEGFRLGGINDPINVPLCSDEDLITFGGRETWDDEKTRNYEVGYKTRKLAGNSTLNVVVFHMDIRDLQTTVTAGTCSSRLVFNVPRARSRGIELEFETAPLRNFDVSFSGSYNDAELRSTLTSTDSLGGVQVVSGIQSGRRLPSVPEVQGAVSASFRFEPTQGSQMYVTGTWQHVGSRYTQVGDEDLGTLDMTALPNIIGGPLSQNTFTYDPELPAYDIVNLRLGLRRGGWDIAVYAHNLFDELAYLALDRERGTVARIGYLTNQPRTIGLSTRFNF